MRNPIAQLNFLFFSTLMAILIWMASTGVKGQDVSPTSFPLSEYEAKYSVKWHGLNAGVSTHKLQQLKNGTFHYAARTEPHVSLLPYHYIESSQFSWKDAHIEPHHYSYNVREGAKRKSGTVYFNWENNTIKNPRSVEPWESSLPAGTQDKLTQTLCLRALLKSGEKQNLSFNVAEEDKFKNYDFKILGEENLTTRMGNIKTLRIEHRSKKGTHTTMWLAQDWEYLPVKMMQFKKGKLVASGEILSFNLAPKAKNERPA